MGDIINKVKTSGLVQIELRELLPPTQVKGLDLAPMLWEGMVLREKPFRDALKSMSWSPWEGHRVALHCSTDAIIPDWAWMLVTSKCAEHGLVVEVGTADEIRTRMHLRNIDNLDASRYEDARLVIKGCSTMGGPEVLSALVTKLQPVVRSLMFGEACSTVPIFKRRQ
ncbi:MAG: DUF2480 family protein [Flavobacteriales bacterium]